MALLGIAAALSHSGCARASSGSTKDQNRPVRIPYFLSRLGAPSFSASSVVGAAITDAETIVYGSSRVGDGRNASR